MADGRTPLVILDAREPQEYPVSYLPGAVQVSPGSDSAKTLASWFKDQAVVLYCSVGNRSSRFARRMAQARFTNMANLEGSIFLWVNEARPLETGTGTPGDRVHPYDAHWGRLLAPTMRADLELE